MSRARSGVSLSTKWLVVMVVAVCAACATSPESVDFSSPPLAAAAGLPPCDTPLFYAMADAYPELLGREHIVPPPVLVSGPSLTTNEAHDCQRLIYEVGGELQYGPLVALLVNIDSIQRADFRVGAVIAEIVNYSEIPYGPLSIEPGISCLWLRGDPARTDAWTGGIIKPAAGVTCASVTGPPDRRLEVRRLVHRETLYPSTGRWMWDHTNNNQFIGSQCGSAWCEIGIPGFSGTASITPETVPGWSDEQYLAHETRDGLRVSGLFGTIDPTAELHRWSAGAGEAALTFSGRGVHVANITLDGNDREARRAYGEKFIAGCDCMNPIPLYVRSRVVEDVGRVHEFSTSRLFGAIWKPMQQSYRQHAGRRAVRWAWNERDEGAWVSCEQGCCRTDALM